VDLAYLRAHPAHLPTFLVHQRIRETPVPGGAICQARRLTLEDGASIFAKFRNDPTEPITTPAPPHFFETEAAGLAWLREAGGVPVPEVIVALPELLALEWVEPGDPSPAAADRFGRELAITHRAGAPTFGAPWLGYIGAIAQDNTAGETWADWFAQRRLAPYLKIAADSGALTAVEITAVERVLADRADHGERPARLHGDLWPGNVLWAAEGRAWLVDPAAHGGHRETDLAQLALFGGAPLLDRILSAYQEQWPLAEGWRERVPLHQLHLLLVHAAMFGSAYRSAVRDAAVVARWG
jgi:fructosamine-3-kinase